MKTEIKPTPGPWKLGPVAGQVEGPNGELLAGGVSFRLSEDQNLANARLIAAAPSLLEVLQEFVTDWDGCRGLTYLEQASRISRARAAIAQAENGEAICSK